VQSGDPSQPSRPPRSRSARPHRNYAASGPQSWMWDAACASADPDLFFPREQRDPRNSEAKRVCARCPVKSECLDYSFATREEFGIWGGLDEWERRALLDQQQRRRQRGAGTRGVA
jgi:WhiB family transcriptional regulator, redox-sensing transcriptional regulator